jgi:ribosome biogenesis GTPase A
MPSFWRVVNKVLDEADLVIEVLDARMIQESRNREIEDKIRRRQKKILYVINKCDLSTPEKIKEESKDLEPNVYISSKERLGTTILKKKILEISQGKEIVVGVVGYPNVGKSSLINALGGKNKARTSAQSGFTKGMQKVKVDNRIILLDTPGVFPKMEKNEAKHGLMGAIDYARIKNPEMAVLRLIEQHKEAILRNYSLSEREIKAAENDEEKDEAEVILEILAFKFHKLLKGGKPDVQSTARMILKDWQSGKMRE